MKKIIISIAVAVIALGLSARTYAQENATPEEIVDMTRKAADFLAQKGEAGIEEFNDPNGRWVWKDSYIMVHNCEKGTVAAHPFKQNMIGKNLMGLKDVKGNLFFVQLCEAAKNPKGDWTEYWWPKPGEKTPSRKISLMRQVPNTPYQVGAGIYDETASIEALRKLIQ